MDRKTNGISRRLGRQTDFGLGSHVFHRVFSLLMVGRLRRRVIVASNSGLLEIEGKKKKRFFLK
jgi:hypothetical protein